MGNKGTFLCIFKITSVKVHPNFHPKILVRVLSKHHILLYESLPTHFVPIHSLFLSHTLALPLCSPSLFVSLSLPFSLSFSVPLYLPFPLNRKQKKFQIFIINTLCLLFFLCNLTRSFTLSKLWTFRIDQEPMRSYMNVTFVIFEFAYLKIQDLILLLDFRDLLWQWPHLVVTT